MPAQSSSAYPYPSQRVIVLRHGERRDNRHDAPPESDPPLTAEGVAEIKNTAARLRHYLGKERARAAVLVVSPFLRTVQTAESLQHHGVGADHAMVVDNTLCEVFGPSRIKTSRAPQLQGLQTSRAVGGLPMWGESLETATERYVANFLRNGDEYGGPLAGGADPNPFSSARTESQTSSSLVCPPAVTRRFNGGGGQADRRWHTVTTPASPDPAVLSSLEDCTPPDTILVTHGDAISAVLSHFYPARVVYEADFLSFIIMRRYGVGNHVYHLDESVGVSWFVDGIDGEPPDPILHALEMEREAAAAAANKKTSTSNSSANGADDGGVDEDDLENDDDEGEALDEDDDEGEAPAQPASFAGSRMRSWASRLPARRFQPRVRPNAIVEATTVQAAALPPTQVHVPVLTHPHLYAGRSRLNATSSSGSNDGVDAHTPSRHYPKAGEDCERIRLPSGTPAQSSSIPVVTAMNDDTNHRRGQSGRSSSFPAGIPSSGGAKERDSDNQGGGGKDEKSLQRDTRPAQPPNIAAPYATESDDHLKWDDGTKADVFLGSVSSCCGLTADPSTNSRVKSQADSARHLSSPATREKAAIAALASPETREDSPAPRAANPIASAASSSPTTVINTPTTTTTTTGAASGKRAAPRCSGVAAPPSMPPGKRCMAHSIYGATPTPLFGTTSFADSITSMHPCISATSAMSATSEGEHGNGHVAAVSLASPIHRRNALGDAARISLFMRALCLPLVVIVPIALHGQLSLVWFCVLATVWEVVFAAVLDLSCRTNNLYYLRIRRAVEQLRPSPVTDVSLVAQALNTRGSADRTAAAADTAAPASAAHEDETDEITIYHFPDSVPNDGRYASSTMRPASHPNVGDDGASQRASPRNSRSTFDVAVLCARHVVATAAKLLALYLLGFVGGVVSGGGHLAQAWTGVGLLFSTPTGLILTMTYGCVNVVRGVWDETRINALLDHR
ncbi:hypothetical protein ABB37_00553 [Leptomonas pyrrhocoris]|uniref:Uncharacterized protein n=1 Tax=Leptomonas pyrrhocoris TaxID=157538 RepID=A0A0N0E0E5_LEPPY|nr:hypothetical protein ABB37_00553 [Leptomonas pyrrhocoris]KPA86355.1 hypothetical protein ABB37_00553 [Leptomonas pyrrhocoris]|eukprot:XP_015664794.1 hypothetical protein ABB37_00553 [Leptomonas pyrrhocoris]